MNNPKIWLMMAIRFILGAIFVYSAYAKLQDSQQFAESIHGYQVFGLLISNWAAVLIPVLEGILGVLLITGIWLNETFLMTLALYLVFDLMIIQAAVRGLDIDCGCFSPSGNSPVDAAKIIQNLVLTILAAIGLYLDKLFPQIRKA